jgi:hypothetical protein
MPLKTRSHPPSFSTSRENSHNEAQSWEGSINKSLDDEFIPGPTSFPGPSSFTRQPSATPTPYPNKGKRPATATTLATTPSQEDTLNTLLTNLLHNDAFTNIIADRDGNRSVPLGMESIPMPIMSVSGSGGAPTEPICRITSSYRFGTDNFRDF